MIDPLYVIPDIHGHRDKLDQALALIKAESGPDAQIVFIGDYIDRGPDSRGVIQTLIDGLAKGRRWTLLRGNHEQLMLDAVEALPDHPPGKRQDFRWLHPEVCGETLASYGVTPEDPSDVILAALPAAHLKLLRTTQLWHKTDDLLITHAGLLPGVSLKNQTPDNLMWIREPFLSDTRDHGRLVVHGHSPVDWPEHHGNRIALDGGAGWGRTLHVAVFEKHKAWLLNASGRHRLKKH